MTSPSARGEIGRFLVVGGTAVLIDAVSYALMVHIAPWSPSWSKRISFALGAIWAFFMNKHFTFRRPQYRVAEPLWFAAVYLGGWFLNSVSHDIVLALSGYKPLAFLVATGISTCTNFAGQKWIVFRQARQRPVTPAGERPAGNVAARLPALLACAVFVYAMCTRANLVDKHFGSIDDIGVAATVLACRDPRFVDALVQAKLDAAETTALKDNPRVQLLRKLNTPAHAARLKRILHPVFRYAGVPILWTYAPLQYALTVPFLHGADTYRGILARGRLPSLLMAMLCFPLLYLLFARLDRSARWWLTLAGWALLAASTEHVIFSVHMSSYAAGCTALLLMLMLLTRAEPAAHPVRQAVCLGLCLVLLLLLNYQTFMFVPAFLGARLLQGWTRSPAQRLPLLRSLATTAAVYAAGLAPVFLLRIRTASTVSWNAGANGEFLFAPEHADAFWQAIGYSCRFFLGNGYAVVGSLVSPSTEGSPAYHAVTVLVILLSLWGFWRLWRDRYATGRTLLAFTAIAGLTWLAFVAGRRLPFCPTRHSLILLPLIAVPVAVGAGSLGRGRAIGPAVLAVGLLTLHALAYPRFVKERRDPFNEQDLVQLMTAHGVQTIVSAGCNNPLIMPATLGRACTIYTDGDRYGFDQPPAFDCFAVVSSTAPISSFSADDWERMLPAPLDVFAESAVREQAYSSVFATNRPATLGVEFSQRIPVRENGLHLQIFRRHPPP